MPLPKCQSTSIDYQYNEAEEIEHALLVLKKAGVLPTSLGFLHLETAGEEVVLRYGFKSPRPTTLLFKLAGLSPGEIKLWHDAESGFFSEARERPGAPPVYKHVSDEVATAILKREVTPELEKTLMTPDPYIGE